METPGHRPNLACRALSHLCTTGSIFSELDICKQFVYGQSMIQSFGSAETERFFATGKSRRLPRDILRRATMRLTQLDGAVRLDDLRVPTSNRLEALAHDRNGEWSIRINDQWRICFRFENGDAYDVEIVDYH
jgi:proteic killer suppression protein